jgi:bifunctional non-homologous end joining protein LigD
MTLRNLSDAAFQLQTGLTSKMATRKAPPRTLRSKNPPRLTVAGVSLSHPDRLIYADLGLSKADLARYYEAIAAWVLPMSLGGR